MRYLFTLLFLGFALFLSAYINPDSYNKMENVLSSRMDCAQATKQIDQDINNVRARLLNGGDVWWNLNGSGRYIVPKVEEGSGIEEVSSIFAGAVWLGGFDPGNNLKVAAQTYRDEDETDFWPGPLDPVTGMVTQEECANWDEFFEVTGEEIRIFRGDFERALLNGSELDPATIPDGVLYWPGRGNPFFEDRYDFELPNNGQGLGAFLDRDEDGIYNPLDGDFPNIEVRGCPSGIFPDQMIFWIYNDNGGTHTNSAGSTPIQMEVQVQSFAFESNDEFNNMTFQRYKLINRATEDIDSCFFAMWVDPDLGCYNDDYIGCDVDRSLAYIYNKDAVDGNDGGTTCFGVPTYGNTVPILGVDYFRGPLSEPRAIYDSIVTDSIVDFAPIELGMSSFTYHNNNIGNPPAATQDPTTAEQFYRYLSGSWRDGTPFTFGGSAYNVGSTDRINYAFVDPPNLEGGWSMCEDEQPDYDRRTIQASGPLLLEPNVVNELIIGVVWVPDQPYPCPDISGLLAADDLAQGLFDNCFKKLRGPDAPDIDIIELNNELILVLSNDTIEALSNNAFEEYQEVDFRAPDGFTDEEKTYVFEGYRIFQLATEASTPIADASKIDVTKARLIADVDLKNDVIKMYNWTPSIDPTGGGEVLWSFAEQNDGNNQGVKKTFRITQDAYGGRLINHKQYYYTAVAYGHNEFLAFDPISGEGQRQPFIVGDRNQIVVTGTPRPIIYQNLQSAYGDGAIVTRLDGKGIGDNFVEITDEQRERFLDPNFDGSIEYKPGQAPIQVTVYNPLEVKNGEYLLEFSDQDMTDTIYDSNTLWTLTDLGSGEEYKGQSIEVLSEKLYAPLGISIELGQTACVGDKVDDANGAIGVEEEYADADGTNWFLSIPDDSPTGAQDLLNFIKTGLSEDDEGLDPNSSLRNMGGLGWNPYYMIDYRTSNNFLTPAHFSGAGGQVARQRTSFCNTNNVDIVFTSDKSKWSRCVVIETSNSIYYNTLNMPTVGGANNFDLRQSPSVSRDDANGDGKADVDDTETMGMGWFPGYAVDVETGERLNIFFGENSSYGPEDTLFNVNNDTIGRDMMFNPSDQQFEFDFGSQVPPDVSNFFLGGQHYVYVTRTKYDSCKILIDGFNASVPLLKFNATQYITWAAMSIGFPETEMLSYADGLIPNDLTVKLRVSQPYAYNQGTNENMGYNAYHFTLDGAQSRAIVDDEIDNALDKINVVPNPYFAYSQYEASQNRNVVRITNLPAQAKVTIYSIDGRFIRQYDRNIAGIPQVNRTDPGITVTQEIPFQEWDLKNYAGIPVSPGVYLIHVEAPELGERVIKWFGVNRKFNPASTQ